MIGRALLLSSPILVAIQEQMITLALLSVLIVPQVSALALAHNSIYGFIAARHMHGPPEFNITMFPEPCRESCVSISETFTACAENPLCRCTEENASLLAVCVNCIVANSDASALSSTEATMSQFNSQCANAMSPMHVTFSITASPTGPDVGLPTVNTSSSNSSSSSVPPRVHYINKGAIAGGIIGGLVLVSLFLCFLRRTRWNPILGAERPFSRLQENQMSGGMVKKAQEDVGKV